ncbi:MAG: hypothetical protein WAT78_00120 [Rhizobiaceae bacterium]
MVFIVSSFWQMPEFVPERQKTRISAAAHLPHGGAFSFGLRNGTNRPWQNM